MNIDNNSHHGPLCLGHHKHQSRCNSTANGHSHKNSHHSQLILQKQQKNNLSSDGSSNPNNQHIEAFQRMQTFIQQLGQGFQKRIEYLQTAKLQQFKSDLLKTKSQFEQLNENRNDNAIRNNIFGKKKVLEKQCNSFLQKSMEVSKMYEGLKKKISEMHAYEEQLSNQIEYLNKKIRITCKKNEQLRKEFEKGEKKLRKNEEIKNMQSSRDNKRQITILGEKISNIQSNLPIKQEQSTKNHNQKTKRRLIEKIQNTKQFMDSLVIEASTIQQIFESVDPKDYLQDRKKMQLMEQLLQREEIKRQIYYLLFSEEE